MKDVSSNSLFKHISVLNDPLANKVSSPTANNSAGCNWHQTVRMHMEDPLQEGSLVLDLTM
jgi:hypothetical protein